MEKKYVTKKEITVYSLSALGQGMVYAAMSSYLSDFYLNVLCLSPLFVFFLLLFARVWDAINDPLMGMIVDHRSAKKKYVPYTLFTAIPIAVLTVFLFYQPSFSVSDSPSYSERGTYVWVAILYVVWGMVYTVCDVPFWSLPNAVTPSASERGKFIGVARMINGIGSAIPMALIMLLGFVTDKNGNGIPYKTRYEIMAIASAGIGCFLLGMTYFTVKERVYVPKLDGKGERPLRLLWKNKQLMLVVLMGFLSCGRYMLQAAAIHVSRYTFFLDGMTVAKSQSTVQLVFGICTAAGTFGAMTVCPFLMKKFSYKALVLTSCLVGGVSAAIGYGVGLLTGFSLWAMIPFLVLSSLPAGVLNVVSYALIGDCLDDMESKTGQRITGLGSACQTFVNKIGNALATVAIVAVYWAIGLNTADMASGAGSEFISAATLPFAVRNAMFITVTLIPAVSMLLCCVPMLFYRLTGKNKEDMLGILAKQREERGVAIEGIKD